MGVFDDALAVLAADPNLGEEATHRAAGTGTPVPLSVLRSGPDRVVDAFDTPLLRATDVLTVAIATLPSIEPGDGKGPVRRAPRPALHSRHCPLTGRRLMGSVVAGENVRGWSVGLGIRF